MDLYVLRYIFLSSSSSEWYPEEMVTFAEALYEMEQAHKKPTTKDMGEKPVEYFYSLVGTRHIDPDDGLEYVVTEVRVNRKQEIVAYRQRFYKGQYEGNVDEPCHVADIYSYKYINQNMLFEQTAEDRDT
jgi:hypothetical protein